MIVDEFAFAARNGVNAPCDPEASLRASDLDYIRLHLEEIRRTLSLHVPEVGRGVLGLDFNGMVLAAMEAEHEGVGAVPHVYHSWDSLRGGGSADPARERLLAWADTYDPAGEALVMFIDTPSKTGRAYWIELG